MSDNTRKTVITSQHVEDYLNCPTKCYLRHSGNEERINSYTEWSLLQSNRYKKLAEQHLAGSYDDACVIRNSTITPSKDQQSWQLSLNTSCKTDKLSSSIHALSKGKEIIPIRFVVRNKLTSNDKVLLAFDALILSQLLDIPIGKGEILSGTAFKSRKISLSPLLGELRKIIRAISKILTSATPPKLSLNKHCTECVFQTRCYQQAKESDDLSLLASLSEKEKVKLNGKGIFTVTQLSYTFRPRRRSKRTADKPEKYHHSLKALATRENKIHVIGKPELKIAGTPVYLDVEGIPDEEFYYLIGIKIQVEDLSETHSFWADSRDDERNIWHQFIDTTSKIENPVFIHYGGYETTFLKRMIERYGCEESLEGRFNDHSINLLSIIYAKIYFPGYTNGLKEIAQYLGFKWNEESASGLQSLAWRGQWEHSGNVSLKERLIHYNQDDSEALSVVTNAIINLTQQDIASNSDSIVDASTLKPAHATKLGHFKSDISHFEQINNAARWDYQRNRIYIRSGLKTKIATTTTKRKKNCRVEMVIKWKVSRTCPECGKQYPKKGKVITRTMHELLFGRDSMKRRLVRYEFQTYICRSCGHKYGLDKRFGHPTRKYGWNVLSYFVFNTIELCVSQNTVVRNLNDMLGFDLHRSNVGNMKTRAAKYYTETRDKILQRIISGPIIHVDETKANLQGKRAYVWVLTNMKEVVFILTESREADFIQDLLSDFNGVLISDFYSAYDSIECEQQKCLVHIMRDLNDETLKHPFDEEFRQLANEFADLVRPMVETVDRYGLKKHFLNKHLKAVDRFYASLENTDYRSELVKKYTKRFIKNRDKLFTFLRHDGVPWNNNNAEHAIKAFAILRNVISGPSTKRGTEDYLVLLSVCRTCEYQGINFFDFLRSGEKDFADYRRKPLEANTSL